MMLVTVTGSKVENGKFENVTVTAGATVGLGVVGNIINFRKITFVGIADTAHAFVVGSRNCDVNGSPIKPSYSLDGDSGGISRASTTIDVKSEATYFAVQNNDTVDHVYSGDVIYLI